VPATTKARSVQSVLLPTAVIPLLIPGAAVAEVIGMQQLTPSQARGSAIGSLRWRGIDVPVLSFEALAGVSASAINARSKMVVLYPLSGRPLIDFFGILVSADPRAMQVDGDKLKSDDGAEDSPYLLQHCRLDGNAIAIPDLAALRDSL